MARPLVLDTSALLAGRPLGPGEDTVVPAAVLDELKPGGRDRRHLDHLLAAGARLAEADPAARAKVAASLGAEAARLSKVDVDVLAVALGLGAELATDDYTVQNVARKLGIPTRGVAQAGITETYTFRARCTGCRRWLDGAPTECPVCGSPVRAAKVR